jgi:hypothetical protein
MVMNNMSEGVLMEGFLFFHDLKKGDDSDLRLVNTRGRPINRNGRLIRDDFKFS